MRKLVVVAVLVIILLGGYTGFWFYQAGNIKSQASDVIKKFAFSDPTSGSKVDLTYEALNVGGFPGAPVLKIQKPQFAFASKGNNMVVSADNLNITRNLLPPYTYHIQLLGDAHNTSQVAGQEPVVTTVHYKAAPTIELAYNENDKTGHMNYKDEGVEFLDTASNQIIYTSGATSAQLSSTKAADGKMNHVAKVDFKGGKYNTEAALPANSVYADSIKLWKDQQIGAMNFSLDLTVVAPENVKNSKGVPEVAVDLKDLTFSTDAFSFNAAGKLNSTPSDLFPSGKVTVKALNYNKIINIGLGMGALAQSEMVRRGETDPALQFIPMDETNRAALAQSIATFLKGIATPANTDNPDITIIFNREQGGNLYVGSLTAPEVIALFQQTFNTQENAPAEEGTPAIEPAPSFKAPPGY